MKNNISIILALIPVLIATPAKSTVLHTKIQGHISSGFDESGLFGQPNTNLMFSPFEINIITDTKKGQVNQQTAFDQLYGQGHDTPIKANFTINGITREIFGEQSSYMLVGKKSYLSKGGLLEYSISDTRANSLNTYLTNSFFMLTDIGYPVKFESKIPSTTLDIYGSVYFEYYKIGHLYYPKNAYWQFSGGTIETSIPEPASWALMVAGFGLLGATLRYARRSRLKAPAGRNLRA